MLLQIACVGSGSVESYDFTTFLYRFATDSNFAATHMQKDLGCYEFQKPTDTSGKTKKLSAASLKNLIGLIGKDLTPENYMIAIRRSNDKFVYSIVSKKMDCGVNFHFTNKGFWKLFIVEYYNYPEKLLQSRLPETTILKFLMSFIGDSTYRRSHVYDTVYGRDYTIYNTFNDSNKTIIPWDAKWDKASLANSLDFFLKEREDSLVEYFIMEHPDSASYVISNSRDNWGAAMIFKYFDNNWNLIKYTSSTPQYPTDCSVYADLEQLNDIGEKTDSYDRIVIRK